MIILDLDPLARRLFKLIQVIHRSLVVNQLLENDTLVPASSMLPIFSNPITAAARCSLVSARSRLSMQVVLMDGKEHIPLT